MTVVLSRRVTLLGTAGLLAAPAILSSAARAQAPVASQAEMRGVANRINEAWSIDAGMLGLDQIFVDLQIEVDASGTIRNVRAPNGIPSDPRARAVFESARRALLDPRTSPLPIPREKALALNGATFRFSPRGLTR